MSRLTIFTLIGVAVFVGAACKPPGAPVSVANTPVSINEVLVADAQDQPRKPLPEMSWNALDGPISKLGDFRGKVVILDFWATYCPPCIEAMPYMNELQQKYGEDKVIVVGLHVGDKNDREKVPEFVKKLAVTYRIGVPEDDLTAYVFGKSNAIPQTAIFGKDGRLFKKFVGFNAQIRPEIDRAVAEAVNSNG